MAILFGRDQLPVIISFFICGVISGAFYDVLRIKRRIFSDRLILLFVDDLLFFVFCTILVIFNAYCFNDGNMKWYEIPVMIAGFAVYRKTLSLVFISFCFYLIDSVKKVVLWMLRPVRKSINKIIEFGYALFERMVFGVYFVHEKYRMLEIRNLIKKGN